MVDATDVLIALRRAGVSVSTVTRPGHPIPAPYTGLVAYLDGGRDERQYAREAVLLLPGVTDVLFSKHNRAIMYVIGLTYRYPGRWL